MSKTRNAKGKMSHGANNSRRFPLSPEMREVIQRYRDHERVRKNRAAKEAALAEAEAD